MMFYLLRISLLARAFAMRSWDYFRIDWYSCLYWLEFIDGGGMEEGSGRDAD